MPGEVDLDLAEVDHRRPRASAATCSPRRKQRPDPGRQLAQAERLRDVVVGAELQPDDLVELGVLRREHDDRHAGLGADDPADLDPGQLRGASGRAARGPVVGPEPLERRPSVGGLDDAEPLGLERLGERLAEGRLVFDDEDRLRHASESTDVC